MCNEDKDDFDIISQANFRKIANSVSKIGYVEGITAGKEIGFQEGFDKGYNEGLMLSFEISKLKTMIDVLKKKCGDDSSGKFSSWLLLAEKYEDILNKDYTTEQNFDYKQILSKLKELQDGFPIS